MLKPRQLYHSNFKIKIDNHYKTIYCNFFAYDDENAISQLAIRIQERIGFITKNIIKIILTKNNIEIRKFINLKELIQESTKA